MSDAVTVAKKLIKHCPQLNMSAAGNLRFGTNKPLRSVGFFSTLLNSITEQSAKDAVCEGIEGGRLVTLMSDAVFSAELYQAVLMHFKRREEEAATLADMEALNAAQDSYFNKDIPTPLSELTVVYNTEVPRKSFLFDRKADIRYPMSFEHVEERLQLVLGRKGFDQFILTNSLDCVIGYQPLADRIIDHPRTPNVHLFNTWDPAQWTRQWVKPEATEIPSPPSPFKELIEFLAGTEADARSIQAWIRDATFSRAEPILVMCGVPGTGKNLLIEEVVAHLVGEHNFRMASRGFNRSQFHNNVTSCRLFFLDETKLTDFVRETLKAYHNGKAAIERKSVDVGDPEPLHASFVLSNNDETNIFLEYSDRKFYAPDLSPIPIEKKIGRDGTQKFAEQIKEACRDDGWLRQLADYLYLNFAENEATKFLKDTVTFKRVCMNGYPHWLRDLKNLYELHNLKGASLTLDSRSAMRGVKHKPAYSDAKAVLEKYALSTGHRFAECYLNLDGTWDIVFNPGNSKRDEEATGDLSI